jgi:cytochrome P450
MPLERVVPAGGAEISGHWLPGGTTIAVPVPVVHRNVKVFGEDANDFRPDRWVEADEHQRIVMERTMLAFGAGKRVCLGRHIAELEMKKVIPRLLLEFDVRTPDTGLPHGIRR